MVQRLSYDYWHVKYGVHNSGYGNELSTKFIMAYALTGVQRFKARWGCWCGTTSTLDELALDCLFENTSVS